MAIVEKTTPGYATSKLNVSAIRKAFFSLRLHAVTPRWLRWCVGEDRLAMSEWQAEHSFLDKFERKIQLFRDVFAWERVRSKITYLEFGVSSGRSLKWVVASNTDPDSRFIGFDTFHGLPEDWGRVRKGSFTTGGNPPEIDDPRVSFRIGLFADTLPEFLRANDFGDRLLVVHLDPAPGREKPMDSRFRGNDEAFRSVSAAQLLQAFNNQGLVPLRAA
jgi:hypothetical protein